MTIIGQFSDTSQDGNSIQRNTPIVRQTVPNMRSLARTLLKEATAQGWDGTGVRTMILHGNDPESTSDSVRKIKLSTSDPGVTTNQDVIWLNTSSLNFYRTTAYKTTTPMWEQVLNYFDLVSNIFRDTASGGGGGDITGLDGGVF